MYYLETLCCYLALTILAGSPDDAAGTLRVSEVNPRYFTNDSGKAVYLTGSHTWQNLQDGNSVRFDYREFLDFLQQHNHNFFRLWAWESTFWLLSDSSKVSLNPLPFMRTGPGEASDGKPKFDLTQFNQEYFTRLRRRVISARDRGFYVGVMLFQGFSIAVKAKNRTSTPWVGHPFHRDNNINGIHGDIDGDGEGYETHTLAIPEITRIQEAYVRKVIDTVNDLDNVIYEISNESQGGSTKWHYHIIEFIHDYEKTKPKQHPVWMSFQWDGVEGSGTNANLFSSPAEVISPGPGEGKEYTNDPPPADGSKVIISDTDHLWGIGGSDSWVWKSFLRGMHPIFMDSYKNSPHNQAPDLDPKWEPVRIAMGYTLTYANRMNLLVMTPQGDLASTGYCLANPGSEYLVYQPESNKPFSVNLEPAVYHYEWFDPQTGKMGEKGTVQVDNGEQSFTPPFENDAVLYLKMMEQEEDK